jgi:hypothetical protein
LPNVQREKFQNSWQKTRYSSILKSKVHIFQTQ